MRDSRKAKILTWLGVLLIVALLSNLTFVTFFRESDRQYQTIAGPLGPAGPAGAQGQQGSAGVQGLTGLQGPRGEKGDTGDIGPQGVQGLQGLIGLTGDTGLQGSAGTDGKDGREIELRGDNDKKQIEWRYAGEDTWRLLVKYCDLTNTCINKGSK